jgi:DUF3102 family protein
MTAVATNKILTEHVDAIRKLGKRVVEDVIEIGRRLADCHDNHLAHGQWLPWLKEEFGWTDQTARNFINVYEQSKSKNFLDLNLPVSSLYLLCAPSTPEKTRSEIIERARGGEPVSVDEVKESIAATKDRKQSKKRKREKESDGEPEAVPAAEAHATHCLCPMCEGHGDNAGDQTREPPRAEVARIVKAWVAASPEAKREFVRERWDEIALARKQLDANGGAAHEDRWVEGDTP